jgi:hypothetical protein
MLVIIVTTHVVAKTMRTKSILRHSETAWPTDTIMSVS